MSLSKYSKISILLFFVIISTRFISCTKDVYIKDVCFQENVLPIFVSKCSMSGCHQANGGKGENGYNLTTYDGIMKGVVAKHPHQSKVYSTTNGISPSMPAGSNPKLTREELSTIKQWINKGAPNSSNCSGVACDTSATTFAISIQPIFKTNCVGCHNATLAQGNINLSNYDAINLALNTNKLLGCIKQQSGFKAMPPSYSISACDILIIEGWITKGAQNN